MKLEILRKQREEQQRKDNKVTRENGRNKETGTRTKRKKEG
jgi:hypothetical protein